MPPPALVSTIPRRSSTRTRSHRGARRLLACHAPACASRGRALASPSAPRRAAPRLAGTGAQPAADRAKPRRPHDLHGQARRYAATNRAATTVSTIASSPRWNNIENVNRDSRRPGVARARPGRSAATAERDGRADDAAAIGAAGAGGRRHRTRASPSRRRSVPGARRRDLTETQPRAVKEPYSEQALRDVQRARRSRRAAPAPPRRRTSRRSPPGCRRKPEPKSRRSPRSSPDRRRRQARLGVAREGQDRRRILRRRRASRASTSRATRGSR